MVLPVVKDNIGIKYLSQVFVIFLFIVHMNFCQLLSKHIWILRTQNFHTEWQVSECQADPELSRAEGQQESRVATGSFLNVVIDI